MTLGRGTLDFVVIGAMKSGTTSFWRGLESHPDIRTPPDKEHGFFNSDGRYAKGLDAYLRNGFPGAGPDDVLGSVTPGYMGSATLDVVVERMRATVPDVRLIALLRDPVDRAVSHFRHGVRTGRVLADTFEGHVAARRREGRGVAIVEDGDYGAVLGRYLEAFDREQLLVLYTEDLDARPQEVYDRAFAFLGVAPHAVPADLPRLNVGGLALRVDDDALEELARWVDAHVDPETAPGFSRGFRWWLRYHWNIAPDDRGRDLLPGTRAALVARYRADAERLEQVIGERPPWLARW